jgi:hypothetical protein
LLLCSKSGKEKFSLHNPYLIEEYLGIPAEEIPLKVKAQNFWNHRLLPAAILYGWNFIEVIENTYPQKFQPCECNQVSNNYWLGKKGEKWAIESSAM